MAHRLIKFRGGALTFKHFLVILAIKRTFFERADDVGDVTALTPPFR
jgi:hypothetical protein